MRHTCPDGTTARLARDASAPVGTLTVRVSLRVTVDVDDYRAEYGRESTAEIRTAVRSAIADAARYALAAGIDSVQETDR